MQERSVDPTTADGRGDLWGALCVAGTDFRLSRLRVTVARICLLPCGGNEVNRTSVDAGQRRGGGRSGSGQWLARWAWIVGLSTAFPVI